jgi:D-beta-D-heptose 7-phosphate kinase / D-beta-D-heptose 1-phosphate adenosyltransferase
MQIDSHTELRQLGRPMVLVIGDLILDRYTWGNSERVSPEAPVIVLQADVEEVRPGGAASVAALLRALEADVGLAGIVGADASGDTLCRLIRDADVEQGAVLQYRNRRTTSKERLIARAANRHPHQILRVDREVRDPLHSEMTAALTTEIVGRIPQSDAVLISDYGKGVCTPPLIAAVLKSALYHTKPILIDPARTADYRCYQGASLLTPNRVEAEIASGHRIKTPDDAIAIAPRLREQVATDAVLIKLDRDGMVFAGPNGHGVHFPTKPRVVYDVTGAGDMVLAMLGLCRAAGMSWEQAIPLANIAAGLEVERLGVTTVTRAEILSSMRKGNVTSFGKVVDIPTLVQLAQIHHQEGRTIVFTNGCFDLLHVGHVSCLQQAAALGDILVVAVNSDESVRRLKGPNRPVVKDCDRGALVAALGCVDYVTVFDEETPIELIRQVRPQVLAKGGTYKDEDVIGREIVEQYGGRIAVTDVLDGVSTTKILRKIGTGVPNLGTVRDFPNESEKA